MACMHYGHFHGWTLPSVMELGVDARFWSERQLSDYNSLSGSNSLTNRVLNKKIII
jgi:hypothetical protein